MDPRVAVYARVSTERQAEDRTIEQQVDLLTAYAAQQHWMIRAEHLYRDDGVSGARLDRPALDRLRDTAARGEVDVILITSPDRLARRYAYQVWLLEEFERVGCQVVFLERPPSNDPQDALVIQIRGAVAEYERTIIADRMRRGRLAALRSGRILPWTVPPYGYQLDPRRPRDPAGVRIDADAAAVVRRIFTWYVEEGLTLYGIAQRLTAEQVPTPGGQAIWNTSTVRKILRNTAYTGTTYGNQLEVVPAKRRYPLVGREPRGEGGESCRLRPREEWIAVPVPSIVSSDLFARAQERVSRNQQWAIRNTKGEYLLRCLISCGRCGLAYGVQSNGRYPYYTCRGANTLVMRHRPEACDARKIRTERLDAAVWEDLCQVLTDPMVLEEALRRAQHGGLAADERAARRQELRRQQGDMQRQIGRLIDAYTAEVITLEELEARRGKMEERLRVLRQEEHGLGVEQEREEHLQEVTECIESFRAMIAQGIKTAPFATRRALIELLVDRVLVDSPNVEIRYVIPLTGIAQRKGVLRLRHRAADAGDQAADPGHLHLPQPGGMSPPGDGAPCRAVG